jgi:hypothetical protein
VIPFAGAWPFIVVGMVQIVMSTLIDMYYGDGESRPTPCSLGSIIDRCFCPLHVGCRDGLW